MAAEAPAAQSWGLSACVAPAVKQCEAVETPEF